MTCWATFPSPEPKGAGGMAARQIIQTLIHCISFCHCSASSTAHAEQGLSWSLCHCRGTEVPSLWRSLAARGWVLFSRQQTHSWALHWAQLLHFTVFSFQIFNYVWLCWLTCLFGNTKENKSRQWRREMWLWAEVWTGDNVLKVIFLFLYVSMCLL